MTYFIYSKSILSFLFFLSCFFINGQATLIVSQNGGGQYKTIQEAIDVSKAGDIVVVKPGTYNENLIIVHSLILIGEDPKTTIIDAQGTMKCISVKIPTNVSGSQGSISNFSLINSGEGFSNGTGNCGILIKGVSDTRWDIVNNIFSNHPESGISSRIAGTVINNIFKDSKQGIFLSSGSTMDIVNNVFTNNSAGIFGHPQSLSVEIYNNIFTENSVGISSGIPDFKSDYNVYWANGIDCPTCGTEANSIKEDPLFSKASPFEFYPTANSPLIDAGLQDLASYTIPKNDFAGNERISNGRIDIGPYEFSMTTSTNNIALSQVDIYPNPTQGILTIDAEDARKLIVSSLRGEKLIELEDKEVDLSSLESGFYLLQVYDANNNLIHAQKVIKE